MSQASAESLKQRKSGASVSGSGSKTPRAPEPASSTDEHPLGAPKHGFGMQFLRIVGFGVYFLTCCVFIYIAQVMGLPLYWISDDWFIAWMALTKQFFGVLVTTMTQWWSPTVVRMSGDKSMKGLLRQTGEYGMLEVDFGERAVLMSNHQLYTDWLYLWWIAYTNNPPTHGHIYIILKDSLKWVPFIGWGMQLYGFIFMARKWATDQAAMRYRLRKLNSQRSGPLSGHRLDGQLDPMWLLIFPEGTNLSANTRASSVKYSEKSGIPDMKHQLLPRSTGLQFALQELRDTVPWLYDCTIAYEGIPEGGYGQDIFTLRSVYFQGRPPRSVNMHWRRYAIADLPLDDAKGMADWVMARWREKDLLLDAFKRNGKFPADNEAVYIEGGPQDPLKTPYINTEVMPRSSVEFLQICTPAICLALVGRIIFQLYTRLFGNRAWA